MWTVKAPGLPKTQSKCYSQPRNPLAIRLVAVLESDNIKHWGGFGAMITLIRDSRSVNLYNHFRKQFDTSQ